LGITLKETIEGCKKREGFNDEDIVTLFEGLRRELEALKRQVEVR
jgi:hypothetical protein